MRGTWQRPAELCERISKAGHLLLVVTVVGLAGYAKLDHEAWQTGTAVARIGLDAQHVTWFRSEADLSWVPAGLVRLVPWLEMAGACALVLTLKTPRLRAVVALALLIMVMGFGALLYIGPFPRVVGVLLLPYLGELAPWLRRLFSRGGQRIEALAGWDLEEGRAPQGAMKPGRLDGVCAIFGVLLLAWHVDWHVRTVRQSTPAPSVVAAFGETFFLQQGWQMFASPPERVGRLQITGLLRDRRGVDLLAAGGRPPGDDAIFEGEASPSAFRTPGDAANVRWYGMLRRLAYGANPALAMHYARFLCREWNAAHGGGDALETLEMRFFWRPTVTPVGTPDNENAEERVDHLWNHGCFQ